MRSPGRSARGFSSCMSQLNHHDADDPSGMFVQRCTNIPLGSSASWWLSWLMQMLKPRALRPGDRIGIVSTSSPVSAGELDRLTAYLGGRGYEVRVADGALDRTGYLAGSAERRAAGLLRMF